MKAIKLMSILVVALFAVAAIGSMAWAAGPDRQLQNGQNGWQMNGPDWPGATDSAWSDSSWSMGSVYRECQQWMGRFMPGHHSRCAGDNHRRWGSRHGHC